MKERPILMNSEMVRAVLAGRKTVTRRVCKYQPACGAYYLMNQNGDKALHMFDALQLPGGWGFLGIHPKTTDHRLPCPFGGPGDRLWVRESYAPRYFDTGAHGYMADWDGRAADVVPEPRWTPSIHMPRSAARIFLDVVSVRVERLRDITEADAIAEGAPLARIQHAREDGGGPIIDGFANLWDSLAPKGARWSDNPWVWRVEFSRVTS